jgi:hypothetical protein
MTINYYTTEQENEIAKKDVTPENSTCKRFQKRWKIMGISSKYPLKKAPAESNFGKESFFIANIFTFTF